MDKIQGNMGDGAEGQETYGSWFSRAFMFPLKLLGINALFLICCIPIITIPAALCGLYGAVQYLYRELYYTTILRSYMKAFLEAFVLRTAMIGCLIAAPVVLLTVASNFLSSSAWLVVGAFLVAALFVLLSWLISQLVYLNLSGIQALKNAMILLCTEGPRNLALICVHAVGLTLLVFGLPVSGFALLVLPVLSVILVTGIVMPVLGKLVCFDSDSHLDEM